MAQHTTHNMQLTSLYCKWPSFDESQYDEKFRQAMEKEIMWIHSHFRDGLTDEELGEILRIKLGKKNIDTDLYRPRRSDLSKEKKGKKGNLLRPSFLYDSGIKRRNSQGRLMIVWKVEPQNLCSYIEG